MTNKTWTVEVDEEGVIIIPDEALALSGFRVGDKLIWEPTDTGSFILKRPDCNPFRDQETFMQACDQTVRGYNQDQFELYCNLIEEEYNELSTAKDKVEALDALVDIIVVSIGAIHSLGANAEGAWHEVMRTNLAKIDQETGKVRKREDGKVLKPEGWTPPDLKPYVDENV